MGRRSLGDQSDQKLAQRHAGVVGRGIRLCRDHKVSNRRGENRVDELGLGPEVPVNRACPDASPPGDLIKGHPGPLRCERLAGRGYYLRAVGDGVSSSRCT